MTVRRRVLIPFVLLTLLTSASGAPRISAQTTETAERLGDARERYERLMAEANMATAAYEAAYGRFHATQRDIEQARAAITRARQRLGRLHAALAARAREVYVFGATSSLELLLTARSLSEFSDRMEFLDRMAQDDVDLATRVAVTREVLRRLEEDLRQKASAQRGTLREARRQLGIVYDRLERAQALKRELEAQFAREEAAAAALRQAGEAPVIRGQALQACPVPGSSFVDSWGAPRSGGRTHQGVDMMATYGTPVYAAQSGTVQHGSSSLGGIQAYVYGDGGDVTYYAHLQGYSGVPSGAHVAAGTLIAYVGDTGNATGTPHLHFEYHPGGGAPVNPYPYVLAVC